VIINRTFDTGLIKSIMFELWEDVAEDDQSKSDYEPDVRSELWLSVGDGSEVFGVYRLHVITGSCLQVHIQIKRDHRKGKSLEIQKAVNKWWLDNLPSSYQKLVSEVPVIYSNVRDFILNNGWCIEGINRQSIKKKGQLVDMWRFGITRSELAAFVAESEVKDGISG